MKKLYILMRNDLPSMNPGKAMAQAAHAANQFIRVYGRRKDVEEWQNESNDYGFGTTIVLSVSGDKLHDITSKCRIDGIPAGTVCDLTYPFYVDKEIYPLLDQSVGSAPPIESGNGYIVFRNEMTCAYVFSDEDNDHISNLPLHP